MHRIPKGLLAGGKFSGSHSTVIKEAEPLLKLWKSIPEVTKIAIGIITTHRPGRFRVKYSLERHAIRAQVRGVSAVQIFYLYGTNLSNLVKVLERIWRKNETES